jgi:hypothetical protein
VAAARHGLPLLVEPWQRELELHQRCQSRRDPGVKLAGIDIGDQSGDGVSDSHCIVQVGQRIHLQLRVLEKTEVEKRLARVERLLRESIGQP